MTESHANVSERLRRAYLSLEGLSLGDALGQRYFEPAMQHRLAYRLVPEGRWEFTDDTVMALSIVETLQKHGQINQDELAKAFARRFEAEPRRGYGATAFRILNEICAGNAWRGAASAAFGGEGSMGNGAAMRVAPLGSYFADDYSKVVEQARLSAEVTHLHVEGIAGAIAVAIAAAWAARKGTDEPAARELFEPVLEFTPPSEVRRGLERAQAISPGTSTRDAARWLGNGARVIAQDTVPFALWCANKHILHYENALWETIAVGGDIDTNCAIVGGIVVLATGREGLPEEWLAQREALP